MISLSLFSKPEAVSLVLEADWLRHPPPDSAAAGVRGLGHHA